MRFDTIVFSQQELCSALESGFKYIAVCDNEFQLPPEPEVNYTAVGNVTASIPLTEAEAAARRIEFDGFFPEFTASDFAFVRWKDESLSIGGGSFGSFVSSYVSSFWTNSFFGSFGSYAGSYFHMYEYEYEYEYGRGGSYSGSYAGSYAGSYGSSYGYVYGSSYRDPYAHIINPFILVNGYGIDLI